MSRVFPYARATAIDFYSSTICKPSLSIAVNGGCSETSRAANKPSTVARSMDTPAADARPRTASKSPAAGVSVSTPSIFLDLVVCG